MGDDFRITVTEGLIHAGGSGWHHDNVAREGYFTMRAAIYLGSARSCGRLSQRDSRKPLRAVSRSIRHGSRSEKHQDRLKRWELRLRKFRGRYDLINESGDVLFMNHKLFSLRVEFQIRSTHNPHKRHTKYPTRELGFLTFEGTLCSIGIWFADPHGVTGEGRLLSQSLRNFL